MDAGIIVAVIAKALAEGAREQMVGGSTKAVRDAYAALKESVKTRYSVANVEQLEQRPDSMARRLAVEEELETANAGDDPALEKLAERLLTLIVPKLAVDGNTVIGGNVKVGDIIGGSRITGDVVGSDIIVGRDTRGVVPVAGGSGSEINGPEPPREVLSSEHALGRIADAVRLNLDQLQLNMEQARRESSQFFRTTMIFSGVAFAIILIGISLMLAGLVTVGIVTTAASIIPEAGALVLFNKDKELRKTIETYHGYILESQRVLTMIDLSETMGGASAKDSVKEQIVFAVLKVTPTKR